MRLDRLSGLFRPLATLFAMAGLVALSACGGGGGAINSPNQPLPPTIPDMVILPINPTIYPGIPATLTVQGGLPPYQAFSDNSAILPVATGVAGDTIVLVANQIPGGNDLLVNVTVTDSSGKRLISTVTVKPALLFQNALTVTPSTNNCGLNVCDGETAVASTVASGPTGQALPGRQIRFDVIFGAFSILTSNPAQPIASSLTVVTDGSGVASVQLQASANATTQQAQVRATDVLTGQQQLANFVIERNTDGSATITVVPSSPRITAFYNDECSANFRIDYYIYGGTPPYFIAPTLPDAVTLSTNVVASSGGFFRVTTNGTCFNPLTFTIVDSAGKQTTATLVNEPGSNQRPGSPAPTPPSALTATPATVTDSACTGKTFNFFITGGTKPYNVSAVTPPDTVTTQPSNANGQMTSVNGMLTGSGVHTFVVVDSGTTQLSRSFTVTCN